MNTTHKTTFLNQAIRPVYPFKLFEEDVPVPSTKDIEARVLNLGNVKGTLGVSMAISWVGEAGEKDSVRLQSACTSFDLETSGFGLLDKVFGAIVAGGFLGGTGGGGSSMTTSGPFPLLRRSRSRFPLPASDQLGPVVPRAVFSFPRALADEVVWEVVSFCVVSSVALPQPPPPCEPQALVALVDPHPEVSLGTLLIASAHEV